MPPSPPEPLSTRTRLRSFPWPPLCLSPSHHPPTLPIPCQAQYCSRYSSWDAITAHAYNGLDALRPILDAPGSLKGVFAIVFTSNPSRVDFELAPTLTPAGQTKLASGEPLGSSDISPLYQLVAHKLVDWDRTYPGRVGAVVGGTRNANGELDELKAVMRIFMRGARRILPTLIPGVGTQGGTMAEVVTAIVDVLLEFGLNEAAVRREMRKVIVNSSSAIDFAKVPIAAASAMADEGQAAIDECLAPPTLTPGAKRRKA